MNIPLDWLKLEIIFILLSLWIDLLDLSDVFIEFDFIIIELNH